MGNEKYIEYKCPNCAGAMEFDATLQQLKCPYCDTAMSVEEYESKYQKEEKTEKIEEDTGYKVYVCKSCGGEIITDETTGATGCPFCGNNIVVEAAFDGNFKPDYIIPFKIEKRVAKDGFREHLKGKKFVPNSFKQESFIDEIKGVYVPFWLFSTRAYVDAKYEGTRDTVYTRGEYRVTETKHYDLIRQGSINYESVPADGSKKMDDDMMQAIEPFNFSEHVDFKKAYLAGYLAERYDVEAKDVEGIVEGRIENSAKDLVRNTISGYSSVTARKNDVTLEDEKIKYALFPVWMLNVKWNGDIYAFAMNGQTGKFIGDIPIDDHAYHMYIMRMTLIIGIILSIILVFVYMFVFL